ncbi:NAD(P)-dependent oxidoreductase [Streptomyces albipurpureus]|uniref:NAD(P)H-binding protein n=1 Tax=Streptomyces albipurpureus TaxID=2897419 RepID=A0ABT0UXB0_9ACTN|nr:NAD(P)H-binding protein [Streptomyces sp. CWNU-1]MCM2393091.1 NAD(P)H-binding protein [Streptomyces sp. CWNU-1]
MKLTVFGATGGIGQEIVKQGLEAGHEVTAVVRDPARLTVTGSGLTVFPADLAQPESLRAAVGGRDAVLSGLGANTRADAGIAVKLTRSVLAAMEAEGTRRLLVVSASPLGDPSADEPLLDRLMTKVVSAVYKDIYVDLTAMEAELSRSTTDWTSVRPPRLLDKPLTGTYRTVIGGNPVSPRFIARADVAHAMLALIDRAETVKQAVGVAY